MKHCRLKMFATYYGERKCSYYCQSLALAWTQTYQAYGVNCNLYITNYQCFIVIQDLDSGHYKFSISKTFSFFRP
jgi:hypothetical protein